MGLLIRSSLVSSLTPTSIPPHQLVVCLLQEAIQGCRNPSALSHGTCGPQPHLSGHPWAVGAAPQLRSWEGLELIGCPRSLGSWVFIAPLLGAPQGPFVSPLGQTHSRWQEGAQRTPGLGQTQGHNWPYFVGRERGLGLSRLGLGPVRLTMPAKLWHRVPEGRHKTQSTPSTPLPQGPLVRTSREGLSRLKLPPFSVSELQGLAGGAVRGSANTFWSLG